MKTDIIDRNMLDEEHSQKMAKPWGVMFEDGKIELFDTEAQACARQCEFEQGK